MRKGVPEIQFEGGVIRDYRGFFRGTKDASCDVLFANVKGEGVPGGEKLNVAYDPTPAPWSKTDDEWGNLAAIRVEVALKLGLYKIENHRLIRISHVAACREGIIAGLTIISRGSDGGAIIQETQGPRQKR